MAKIVINNHFSHLKADLETMVEIIEAFKIKSPGYFYSPAWKSRQWDGKIKYITDGGRFATGLLPDVMQWLAENSEGDKLSVIDHRVFDYSPEPITKVGKMELRGYQLETLQLTLSNKLHGIPFYRGIWDLATNSGKNLASAAMFESFGKDIPTLFLVNRKHIFNQAKDEIGGLFPSKLGLIGENECRWGMFTIAMVQTLCKNLKKFEKQLSKVDMCIADECHYASGASYQKILTKLQNSTVRIGMSGTPFMHKDPNKNRVIESFFGPILKSHSNKDLIDAGYSTKPLVTILRGNTETYLTTGSFKEEEDDYIVNNRKRNNRIIKRINWHLGKGRENILVFCKYVNHVEDLAKLVEKKLHKIHGSKLVIRRLHNNVKSIERNKILKEFKSGKVNVLVSGYLLKEGQNLPLIKALINAGGSDSAITIVQIVGRALRKHDSKDKVYIDDFFDQGKYLQRHSKHRIKYYKSQKFKVVIKHSIKTK